MTRLAKNAVRHGRTPRAHFYAAVNFASPTFTRSHFV